MFNFDLSQDIEAFILAHSPCKEYDIIQHLQHLGRLNKDCLTHPVSLFKSHFLIFNALYRLQLNAMVHRQYDMSISSLAINVSEHKSNAPSKHTGEISGHDPLALFYLDTDHLINVTADSVHKLLDYFWLNYFNDTQKQTALDTLGLTEPVDFKTIKHQYRRLAMQHHPDRGGDANILIEIHQAMQCLQHYYT